MFVYMLFSRVCDPPRDICICCCAYLRSYYSTGVILHYSTEFKVYVRHWYCVAVIHGILHFAEYGDMMLLYGKAQPSL